MAKVTFGNREAGVLCSLAPAARLPLIAEGLPIILVSAEGSGLNLIEPCGALRLCGFA